MAKKQLPVKKRKLPVKKAASKTKTAPPKKRGRKSDKFGTMLYQTDCFGWLYDPKNATCKKCGHRHLCADYKNSLDHKLGQLKGNYTIQEDITQRYAYPEVIPSKNLDIGHVIIGKVRCIVLTREMFLNGTHNSIKRKIHARGKFYSDSPVPVVRCKYGLCSWEKQDPLTADKQDYIFVFKIWDEES